MTDDTIDPDAPPYGEDDVDLELMELPAPPQARRTLTVTLMLLVVAGCLSTVLALRHDVAYFFADDAVRDLGDVTALDPDALEANVHVLVHGQPSVAEGVRFQRVMTGQRFVVAPFAGQRDIYVQVPDVAEAAAPVELRGRLVPFAQLGGRIDEARHELAEVLGMPVTDATFVLVVGERPGGALWAVVFSLLALLLALLDLALLFGWFRRIPELPVAPRPVALEG